MDLKTAKYNKKHTKGQESRSGERIIHINKWTAAPISHAAIIPVACGRNSTVQRQVSVDYGCSAHDPIAADR